MSDTIVIIPTLNEIENIKDIISAVFSDDKKFHILVVDDNSQDGTPEMVEELMQEFPERLFLEKRKGKKGLGSAYIHGFKWALKRSYDYIIEMDADFSHNPKDLIKLYNACVQDGAKLSVGSRYVNNNVNVINCTYLDAKYDSSNLFIFQLITFTLLLTYLDPTDNLAPS